VSVRESARPRPGDGELTLVTGRLLEHYQSGAQTRRVPELLDAQPEALASLHPATADRLGIADGDDLEVANHRGAVRVRARVTTDIRPDAVFLPFHYGDEQAANLLTSDAVDPVSSMPEFKTNVVRVTRLTRDADHARLTEAGVPA
jgi:assimilatory nitrate reductase catalytic subunit